MFTSAGLSFGNWNGLRRDNTKHDHVHVHVYLLSLWHTFTRTKCTHTKTHTVSLCLTKRHKPLKPFHIKDDFSFFPAKQLTREIRLYLMYSLRLLTYQLGSGNTTCTITTYLNIKMWTPSHYSWIQMYNISFNVPMYDSFPSGLQATVQPRP